MITELRTTFIDQEYSQINLSPAAIRCFIDFQSFLFSFVEEIRRVEKQRNSMIERKKNILCRIKKERKTNMVISFISDTLQFIDESI